MTTNIELIELAKELQIPNFHCLMRDEILKLENIQLPISIILNLEDSPKNGSHLTLLFVDNKEKIYFSSFGDIMPVEVKEFMKKIDNRPILTSDHQIQKFEETTCGLYSLLILYLVNNGEKFEDIILELLAPFSKAS